MTSSWKKPKVNIEKGKKGITERFRGLIPSGKITAVTALHKFISNISFTRWIVSEIVNLDDSNKRWKSIDTMHISLWFWISSTKSAIDVNRYVRSCSCCSCNCAWQTILMRLCLATRASHDMDFLSLVRSTKLMNMRYRNLNGIFTKVNFDDW